VTEEGLKMRIEVHVIVHRICELVQTSTVSHIFIVKLDLYFINLSRAQITFWDIYPVFSELYR
jgi:hypothetical protein